MPVLCSASAPSSADRPRTSPGRGPPASNTATGSVPSPAAGAARSASRSPTDHSRTASAPPSTIHFSDLLAADEAPARTPALQRGSRRGARHQAPARYEPPKGNAGRAPRQATAGAKSVDEDKAVAKWMLEYIDKAWETADQEQSLFEYTDPEVDQLYLKLKLLCCASKRALRQGAYPTVHIRSPIMVLGDLHGSFEDLHFFLQEFYDRNPGDAHARPERPVFGGAGKARRFRIGANVVMVGNDGEQEVAPMAEVEDAMSQSSEHVARGRPVSSKFTAPTKTKKLLFLGDLVDRGYASLEVALYVLALKVMSPENVHVLRGNHELKDVNAKYGFKEDMETLFGHSRGLDVWERICSVFDVLPLAAIVDKTIFCAHGGIPRAPASGPDDRFDILHDSMRWRAVLEAADQKAVLQEPGFRRYADVFYDLLWADPADDENCPALVTGNGFVPNVQRGISVQYGHAALKTFLTGNGLELLLRAHEVQTRGFRVCKSEKVMTVFTSSHYCGDDNLAGVAMVMQGLVRAVIRM